MRARDASTDAEIQSTLVSDPDLGFTMLVRRYQPGIYSGARRLTRRHEDAQEVAQDTFLRAYRALNKYDESRIRNLRIEGWLWTIALNLCRNRATRANPESPGEVDPVNPTPDIPPIDAEMWNRRLSKLSHDQRTAVVLRHVVDLPLADIAQATGRPEGTVKADISRGLNKLREAVQREELAS
jgi:RNA polymerase sigma-70 factor (ECF subfamily)